MQDLDTKNSKANESFIGADMEKLLKENLCEFVKESTSHIKKALDDNRSFLRTISEYIDFLENIINRTESTSKNKQFLSKNEIEQQLRKLTDYIEHVIKNCSTCSDYIAKCKVYISDKKVLLTDKNSLDLLDKYSVELTECVTQCSNIVDDVFVEINRIKKLQDSL